MSKQTTNREVANRYISPPGGRATGRCHHCNGKGGLWAGDVCCYCRGTGKYDCPCSRKS